MRGKEVTFVLFGGTGDLAKTKLVPSISNLLYKGKISSNSTIIGLSRKDFTSEKYKEFLIDSVKGKKHKDNIKKLNIKFLKLDFAKEKLTALKELMIKCDIEGCNRIYYLATGFKFFPEIVKKLKEEILEKSKKGFTRIVFEKPFGHDLRSSINLSKKILHFFPEKEVFCLDHYLAKENVMNIELLKSNPNFNKTFNNKFVSSIEIIVDEKEGVGNRMEFYNNTGALKDMVQSHLLQLLSILLSKNPVSSSKKIEVLKNIELFDAKDNLFGQYQSYKKEAIKTGLNPKKIETFVNIELNCKLKEWEGVKLNLRTGKKLKNKLSQIIIHYKKDANISKNKFIINVFPKKDIIFMGKKISHNEEFNDEYSFLLSKCIDGDKKLFVEKDEIEQSWKIISKIEKMKDKIKFVYYKENQEVQKIA